MSLFFSWSLFYGNFLCRLGHSLSVRGHVIVENKYFVQHCGFSVRDLCSWVTGGKKLSCSIYTRADPTVTCQKMSSI